MAVKDPLLLKFGDNVRRRRNSRGFSQDELASEAGIHRTFISGIERGVRNAGLLSVIRIAKALNTTSAKLMEGLD